jgi:hypothetical protein
MGVRRTFWSWSQRPGSMVTTAKPDAAAGRVPWVSTKPPLVSSGSAWAAVGSGAYDAEIDQMLKALGTVPGPVWLTVHHEPEGGGSTPAGQTDDPGGAAAWRAMQTRIRQRITATGVRNVAFAPVLMSWTFDSRSGRNPAEWWVPGIWDFAGIDHYVDASATTMETTMWNNARAFYTTKGLDMALGEWGNKDHGPTGAAEMQAFYDMARRSGSSGKAQVVALAYFDTDLNGGVPLSGDVLVRFRELMKAPTSLRSTQSGF